MEEYKNSEKTLSDINLVDSNTLTLKQKLELGFSVSEGTEYLEEFEINTENSSDLDNIVTKRKNLSLRKQEMIGEGKNSRKSAEEQRIKIVNSIFKNYKNCKFIDEKIEKSKSF